MPLRPFVRALAVLVLALCAARSPLAAQADDVDPPMINRSTDPLLSNFRLRNIGPASMGGRIHDIEVSESSPSTIYLGYACLLYTSDAADE